MNVRIGILTGLASFFTSTAPPEPPPATPLATPAAAHPAIPPAIQQVLTEARNPSSSSKSTYSHVAAATSPAKSPAKSPATAPESSPPPPLVADDDAIAASVAAADAEQKAVDASKAAEEAAAAEAAARLKAVVKAAAVAKIAADQEAFHIRRNEKEKVDARRELARAGAELQEAKSKKLAAEKYLAALPPPTKMSMWLDGAIAYERGKRQIEEMVNKAKSLVKAAREKVDKAQKNLYALMRAQSHRANKTKVALEELEALEALTPPSPPPPLIPEAVPQLSPHFTAKAELQVQQALKNLKNLRSHSSPASPFRLSRGSFLLALPPLKDCVDTMRKSVSDWTTESGVDYGEFSILGEELRSQFLAAFNAGVDFFHFIDARVAALGGELVAGLATAASSAEAAATFLRDLLEAGYSFVRQSEEMWQNGKEYIAAAAQASSSAISALRASMPSITAIRASLSTAYAYLGAGVEAAAPVASVVYQNFVQLFRELQALVESVGENGKNTAVLGMVGKYIRSASRLLRGMLDAVTLRLTGSGFRFSSGELVFVVVALVAALYFVMHSISPRRAPRRSLPLGPGRASRGRREAFPFPLFNLLPPLFNPSMLSP